MKTPINFLDMHERFVALPQLLCRDCGLIQYVSFIKPDKLEVNEVHTKECKYASKD